MEIFLWKIPRSKNGFAILRDGAGVNLISQSTIENKY